MNTTKPELDLSCDNTFVEPYEVKQARAEAFKQLRLSAEDDLTVRSQKKFKELLEELNQKVNSTLDPDLRGRYIKGTIKEWQQWAWKANQRNKSRKNKVDPGQMARHIAAAMLRHKLKGEL